MQIDQPATQEQVCEVIRAAVASTEHVEVVGAGSKQPWGRPSLATRQLRLDALSGIEQYQPEELVVTARAGTPLTEMTAELARHGQHLPFEPPDFSNLLGTMSDRQTLGGIFNCNLSGPRRPLAGAARDYLLGVQGVTGRGELIKAGGRVVKNVTGYDVPRLMAGAFGTLTALTQVSFKVLPRPASSETLVVSDIDATQAVALFSRALGSPLEVSGTAWLPASLAPSVLGADAPSSALLRIEGHPSGVAVRIHELQDIVGPAFATQVLRDDDSAACWLQIRNVQPLVTSGPEVVWRILLKPTAAPLLLQRLRSHRAYLDWGGGLVWLALPVGTDAGASNLRSTLEEFAGHATLIRGPAELRARIDVFTRPAPALLALTKRVKQAFDPLSILNRGRMYADL